VTAAKLQQFLKCFGMLLKEPLQEPKVAATSLTRCSDHLHSAVMQSLVEYAGKRDIQVHVPLCVTPA
jgi:hypothetical protein